MKIPRLKKGKRPFGINAIIVLLALLVLNNGVDVIRAIIGLPPHTFPEMDALVIQGLNAAIAIFYAILALGLWQMRDWARAEVAETFLQARATCIKREIRR